MFEFATRPVFKSYKELRKKYKFLKRSAGASALAKMWNIFGNVVRKSDPKFLIVEQTMLTERRRLRK
jgi:hypothetical protein